MAELKLLQTPTLVIQIAREQVIDPIGVPGVAIDKLGVSSRTQAIVLAKEAGL